MSDVCALLAPPASPMWSLLTSPLLCQNPRPKPSTLNPETLDSQLSGLQAEGGSPSARGGSADDLSLVEIGVRCSLEQMLDEGFYHADPHPGNLLKLPDGRLAYLDFGMMGQIQLKVADLWWGLGWGGSAGAGSPTWTLG
eukprot:221331-Chlamydomonas_euryale.AAC.1